MGSAGWGSRGFGESPKMARESRALPKETALEILGCFDRFDGNRLHPHGEKRAG
jgi:hypothetical protein